LQGGLGRADARTAPLLDGIGPFDGEASDMQRETPRRHEGGRAFIEEAALDERIGHETLQILGGAALHPRRDLLAEEFE